MEILKLLKTPAARRDLGWEKEFFKALPSSYLKISRPDPLPGPDGWPYLLVELHENAAEPFGDILRWLSTRGIGLVINPNQSTPDFVFTYGMIWNFLETGAFIVEQEADNDSIAELKDGETIFVGEPSEKYFPKYARAIVREFLNRQGAKEPKIVMASRDKKKYDLCFSLESLGSPPVHEHRGILEALSWFFPMHYSFAILSEKNLAGFAKL